MAIVGALASRKRAIAQKRNAIIDSGDLTDEASAKDALAVASYLLNNTFQKLLWLNGLYLVPEHQVRRTFIPEEGLQIIIQLALISDVRKLCNPDGSLKKVNELDADTAAAVASFEVDEVEEPLRASTISAVGEGSVK